MAMEIEVKFRFSAKSFQKFKFLLSTNSHIKADDGTKATMMTERKGAPDFSKINIKDRDPNQCKNIISSCPFVFKSRNRQKNYFLGNELIDTP